MWTCQRRVYVLPRCVSSNTIVYARPLQPSHVRHPLDEIKWCRALTSNGQQRWGAPVVTHTPPPPVSTLQNHIIFHTKHSRPPPHRFLPRPAPGVGGNHPRAIYVLLRLLAKQGVLDGRGTAGGPTSGLDGDLLRGDCGRGAEHNHQPDLDGQDPHAGDDKR